MLPPKNNMADHTEEHSEPGFAQIKPLAVELNRHHIAARCGQTQQTSKQLLFAGLGLIVLSATAVLVIFFLPHWVEPPELAPKQAASVNSSTQFTAARPTQPAVESPWERAQQSRMRKQTQEILARILDAQKALENNGVTVWAEKEYAQAVQHAKAGDQLYNRRDFAAARTAYQSAMEVLETLMGQVDDVFKAALEEGQRALGQGAAEAALAAFRIALAIDSIDRDANAGYARAQTLDQVNALIDQGDELLDEQQLQQARALYKKALEIDAQSARAAGQIRLLEQKILEREFTRHMSSGFAALERKQYQQARRAFTSALKLKPKSTEAHSAIRQTQHSITRLNINALLADAGLLETQERWHEALSNYDAALTLNANLAAAQQGRQRATVRAATHDKLERILASPRRLYDREVYAETVSFHKKLLALADPGPLLSSQLDKLERQLQRAQTPVMISLQSDRLTKVIVYRVGELGYFLDKQIALLPGTYVALGQRNGYKDIRVEFTVDPDKPAAAINIRAQEKIALQRF